MSLHIQCPTVLRTTSNPQMYAAEWLAQVPFPFVVEEGPELRSAVAELAGRLSAAVERR